MLQIRNRLALGNFMLIAGLAAAEVPDSQANSIASRKELSALIGGDQEYTCSNDQDLNSILEHLMVHQQFLSKSKLVFISKGKTVESGISKEAVATILALLYHAVEYVDQKAKAKEILARMKRTLEKAGKEVSTDPITNPRVHVFRKDYIVLRSKILFERPLKKEIQVLLFFSKDLSTVAFVACNPDSHAAKDIPYGTCYDIFRIDAKKKALLTHLLTKDSK